MVRHTARLQARGYWGQSTHPTQSWNLILAACYAQAQSTLPSRPRTVKRTDTFVVADVQVPQPVTHLYVCDPQYLKNWKATKKRKNDAAPGAGSAPGVMLDWSITCPAAMSAQNAWSSETGAMQYVGFTQNAFGGLRPGLEYWHGVPNDLHTLQGPSVPQDTGTAMYLYLHPPPAEQKVPVWSKRWGDVPRGTGWAFRVVDGRAQLVQLTRAWTQAKEWAWWALKEIIQDDAATQAEKDAARAQADPLEAEIFAVQHDIEAKGRLYNRPFRLVIVPEGLDFSVWVDDVRTRIEGGLQADPNEDNPEAGATSTVENAPLLWHAAPMTLAINGGAFFWQVGYPEFSSTGDLRLSSVLDTWNSAGDLPLNQIDAKFQKYAPAGTSITMVRRPVLNDQGQETGRVELVARFTTTNTRVSPIAFSCALLLKGGPRDGADVLAFDTQPLIEAGHPDPIANVIPQCEGENQGRQWQVIIRLRKGKTLSPSLFPNLQGFYEYLEGRLATLWIDGNKVISQALITKARVLDAASCLPNEARTTTERAESVLVLTVCDGYRRMREKLVRDEVGDGRYRGEYLRLLLANVGFKESELAGIPLQAGGRLRSAKPGEGWKIRPRKGQSYEDWIQAFLKTYCRGWLLYQDKNGVWQFVKASKESVATFSSSATRNNSKVYPQRYAILRKLEKTRDVDSGFANVWQVEGADDPQTGETIARVWRDEESIALSPTGGGALRRSKTFVGRDIEAPVTEDATVESVAEANALARYAAETAGTPGFLNFTTYFHTEGLGAVNLMPGFYITCDGVKFKIVRIADGSLATDRMDIGTNEVPGRANN